jgi:hypothetical protein
MQGNGMDAASYLGAVDHVGSDCRTMIPNWLHDRMMSESAGTVSAKVFEPAIWKSKLAVVWYQRRSRAFSQTVGNVRTSDRFAHASVNHRSVGLISTVLRGTSCGSRQQSSRPTCKSQVKSGALLFM